MEGVRNIYVYCELDMDTAIVQGFLNRWCASIEHFNVIQNGAQLAQIFLTNIDSRSRLLRKSALGSQYS